MLIGNRQAEVAHAVAPLLQMNEPDLAQRLMPRLRSVWYERCIITNRYIVLKRKVSADTWAKVRDTMAQLAFNNVSDKTLTKAERGFYRDLRAKAIFTDPTDDQLRTYPSQNLAAHVLGYVGVTERTNNGLRTLETVGVDGIERTLDSKLKGVGGWRATEVDRQQREMVALREQDVEPHDGMNVGADDRTPLLQQILQTRSGGGRARRNSPSAFSAMVPSKYRRNPGHGWIAELRSRTVPGRSSADAGARPCSSRTCMSQARRSRSWWCPRR